MTCAVPVANGHIVHEQPPDIALRLRKCSVWLSRFRQCMPACVPELSALGCITTCSLKARAVLQGRRFWLAYAIYYKEAYGSLEYARSIAEVLMPTQSLLNIGVWLHWSEPGCEDADTNRKSGDHDGDACPPAPYICLIQRKR